LQLTLPEYGSDWNENDFLVLRKGAELALIQNLYRKIPPISKTEVCKYIFLAKNWARILLLGWGKIERGGLFFTIC